MGELYKLDFPNGKSYIGITKKTAENRFKGHKRAAEKMSNLPVYCAWRKHGEPLLKVLAVLEDKDLAESEVKAINAFGTLFPCGYNMEIGGYNGCAGSPAIIEKLKKSSKVRWEREKDIETARQNTLKQFACGYAIENHSKITKEKFKDPEYAKRHREGILKFVRSDKWRKDQSERKKKFYENNPEAKSLAVANMQSEQARKARGAKMKALWATPEFRQKMKDSKRDERNV